MLKKRLYPQGVLPYYEFLYLGCALVDGRHLCIPQIPLYRKFICITVGPVYLDGIRCRPYRRLTSCLRLGYGKAVEYLPLAQRQSFFIYQKGDAA
jgi:hypothetical protein